MSRYGILKAKSPIENFWVSEAFSSLLTSLTMRSITMRDAGMYDANDRVDSRQ